MDIDHCCCFMLYIVLFLCCILCSIKQYKQAEFVVFSIYIQLYNIFPWIFQWVGNRTRLRKNVAQNREQVRQLTRHLQETLNAHTCRGFVDSFLARKQKLEVMKSNVSSNHAEHEFIKLFISMKTINSWQMKKGYRIMKTFTCSQGFREYGLVLQQREPCVNYWEPLCGWYWYYSNYTEMVSIAHGQIS